MRFNKDKGYHPGPTSYNTTVPWLTIGGTPKISWNKAKREELFLSREKNPGPGSYDLNKNFNKTSKTSTAKVI